MPHGLFNTGTVQLWVPTRVSPSPARHQSNGRLQGLRGAGRGRYGPAPQLGAGPEGRFPRQASAVERDGLCDAHRESASVALRSFERGVSDLRGERGRCGLQRRRCGLRVGGIAPAHHRRSLQLAAHGARPWESTARRHSGAGGLGAPLGPRFAGNLRARYTFAMGAFGAEAYFRAVINHRGRSVFGMVGSAELMDDTLYRQAGRHSGLKWRHEGGTFGTVPIRQGGLARERGQPAAGELAFRESGGHHVQPFLRRRQRRVDSRGVRGQRKRRGGGGGASDGPLCASGNRAAAPHHRLAACFPSKWLIG